MDKYEYRVMNLAGDWNTHQHTLLKLLNKDGEEGWEACCNIFDKSTVSIVYKRRVEEPLQMRRCPHCGEKI